MFPFLSFLFPKILFILWVRELNIIFCIFILSCMSQKTKKLESATNPPASYEPMNPSLTPPISPPPHLPIHPHHIPFSLNPQLPYPYNQNLQTPPPRLASYHAIKVPWAFPPPRLNTRINIQHKKHLFGVQIFVLLFSFHVGLTYT